MPSKQQIENQKKVAEKLKKNLQNINGKEEKNTNSLKDKVNINAKSDDFIESLIKERFGEKDNPDDPFSVEMLKQSGPLNLINLADTKGRLPLHTAVEYGKTKSIKYLIQNGADINLYSKKGFTPLHIAVENGMENIVNILINAKANLNIKVKSNENTIFHILCLRKTFNEDLVDIIFQSYAKMNESNKYGDTPSHICAAKGNVKILEKFYEKTMKFDSFNEEGLLPYHTAIINDQKNVWEWFLKTGFDKNAKTEKGETPLSLAIKYKAISIIKKFIDLKIDLDADEELNLALSSKNEEIIRIIKKYYEDNISKNVLKEITNKNEEELKFSSNQEINFIYEYIIKVIVKGHNLDYINDFETTSLHLASACGYFFALQQITSEIFNINIDAKDKTGTTALQAAILGKHYLKNSDICKSHDSSDKMLIINHLLDKKADLYILNDQSISPVIAAVLLGDKNILNLFYKKDANIIYTKGMSDSSLSHYAVASINIEILSYLNQDLKISLRQADQDGLYPIDYLNFMLINKTLSELSINKLKAIMHYFIDNDVYPASHVHNITNIKLIEWAWENKIQHLDSPTILPTLNAVDQLYNSNLVSSLDPFAINEL